jgi:hypothetical protein
MKTWQRRTLATAAGAAGGALAVVGAGGVAWERATARDVARVHQVAARFQAPREAPAEAAELPAPVARFFAHAIRPGRAPVRAARIEHAGAFRTGLHQRWMPFRSVQHFSARPPAFVWNASMRMAPLVGIRVRDSYLDGSAGMTAKLAGVVPLVDEQGGRELGSGALHRFLAEAVWLPTALLPGGPVSWKAVDDSTAIATLTDGDLAVSLEFRFNDRGEVLEVFTPERYRDVNGTGVPTPWRGRFRNYADVDGFRVPMEGEVEWQLPEGRLVYWRGRIVAARYE